MDIEFQVSSILTPVEFIATTILATSPLPSSTAASVMAYVRTGDNVDQVFLPLRIHSLLLDFVSDVEGRPPPRGLPSSGSEAMLLAIAPD